MDKLKEDLTTKGYFCVYIDNVNNSEISKMNELIDASRAVKSTNNMENMFKTYKYNEDNICVYLINKEINKIIGYVISKKPDTKDDIVILDVAIHPAYRKKGLCKIMIQYFILSVNESIKNVKSFELLNAGEEPSFRCYLSGFSECGYVSHIIENDGTLTKINKDHDDRTHSNYNEDFPYLYELKFIKKSVISKKKENRKTKTKKTVSSKQKKGGNHIRKSMTKK